MGITIHYAGRALSEDSIAAAFKEGIEIAHEFGWEARVPPADTMREEGLVFFPHVDCEPVYLRFTRTRRFSEFCKTQFAGPSVHLQVLEFLERLSGHFSNLIVYDEAEDILAEGEDMSLEEAFDKALAFIKDGLLEYPDAQMKVRLPSGRIADLIG